MIAQARLWWSGRSARERWLLGIMAALFGALILWLGVIRPLDAARLAAALRLDTATLDAGRIRAADAALKSVRGATPALESLPSSVSQAATTSGFTLARLDVQGPGSVAFSIATARSPALFGWIDALERQGIVVDKIALRPNSDGTLAVEGVLRGRSR